MRTRRPGISRCRGAVVLSLLAGTALLPATSRAASTVEPVLRPSSRSYAQPQAAKGAPLLPIGTRTSDGGTYIGNNTCRYTGTTWSYRTTSGNGTAFAGGNQDAYATSENSLSAVVPTTASSSAETDAGYQVYISPSFPQPTSVTVSFPWHLTGHLYADTGLAGATAQASVRLAVALSSFASARTTVYSNSAASTNGVADSRVVNTGWIGAQPSLTIPTSSNAWAFGRIELTTSDTVSSAAAQAATARSDFAYAGHAWTDHQDWRFNLPPGYTITSC